MKEVREGDNQVLKLHGWDGAPWDSGHTFYKEGTRDQLKRYFRGNISTGYSLRVKEGKDRSLVPPEFYYSVGGVLYTTLEYDDLIAVTSTLDRVNSHMMATGRGRLTEQDRLYHALKLLETDAFKAANPEDRMGLIPDEVKIPSEYHAAVSFMRDRYQYLVSPHSFGERYPTLKPTVQQLWETEVCEASIDPFLATL